MTSEQEQEHAEWCERAQDVINAMAELRDCQTPQALGTPFWRDVMDNLDWLRAR